jgi:spore coat polysaccharide biosynthesis protein SpsF
MSVLGIIQARYSSERLPGKMLKNISGKPLIFHIVQRMRQSKMIDKVILATSTEGSDDILEETAMELQVNCFRGSLNDVMDRFVQAGKEFHAKNIVRICGDNPLIDPLYIDKMVKCHLREKADYTNCCTEIPIGTAGEVVSFERLEAINRQSLDRCYREHVTTYFLEYKEKFRVYSATPPLYLKGKSFRLTVDTKEDMELMRKIYQKFYRENKIVNIREVIKFLEKNPRLLSINKNIEQKDWKKTA